MAGLRPEALRTAAISDLATNLTALKKGRQDVEVGVPTCKWPCSISIILC